MKQPLDKKRESIDLIHQRLDVEWVYPEEDVRSAIKELKEDILEWDWQAHKIIELIEKHFGSLAEEAKIKDDDEVGK